MNNEVPRSPLVRAVEEEKKNLGIPGGVGVNTVQGQMKLQADSVPRKHVVMFSGGIGSWAAAKRVAATYGTENLTLLFTDTMMEDEDLYRFIDEAAANVGGTFVRLCDGRTPWEVFEDEKFIGNNRVDPCSRVLKRSLMDKWRDANCDPLRTTIYVGIDWTEKHRLTKLHSRCAPWIYEAPLCAPPFRLKSELLEELKSEGIRPPRLYDLGFSHNNCGGFCCKAGHAHFRLLLKTMPERYAFHEAQEAALMAKLGGPWGILKDRRGGTAKPLTLKQFRERIEQDDGDYERDDLAAGCGCALN